MRLVRDVGLSPERVHVCDLRAHELAWFPIDAGRQVTANDWLQAHASTGLDLFCAVPYGAYLMLAVCYAIWLAFAERGDSSGPSRATLFGCAFVVVNVAGFVTYHVYPAAPPWYFHAHGCAVDLTTLASPGPNLTRVDALLGVPVFARLYGQSSSVFGAVPSLHVAYPLLMLLAAWPMLRVRGRTLLAAYFFWMCFAAVYLDHHWVTDVVAGGLYALVVFAVVGLVLGEWRRGRWRDRPQLRYTP
jgi:hypothetical protein